MKAKEKQLKFKMLDWEWDVSLEEAVKIICWVYDWRAEDVFKRKVITIPFWLGRAANSDKLTVDKAMLIQNYLVGKYFPKKKSIFSFLKGTFK